MNSLIGKLLLSSELKSQKGLFGYVLKLTFSRTLTINEIKKYLE